MSKRTSTIRRAAVAVALTGAMLVPASAASADTTWNSIKPPVGVAAKGTSWSNVNIPVDVAAKGTSWSNVKLPTDVTPRVSTVKKGSAERIARAICKTPLRKTSLCNGLR